MKQSVGVDDVKPYLSYWCALWPFLWCSSHRYGILRVKECGEYDPSDQCQDNCGVSCAPGYRGSTAPVFVCEADLVLGHWREEIYKWWKCLRANNRYNQDTPSTKYTQWLNDLKADSDIGTRNASQFRRRMLTDQTVAFSSTTFGGSCGRFQHESLVEIKNDEE